MPKGYQKSGDIIDAATNMVVVIVLAIIFTAIAVEWVEDENITGMGGTIVAWMPTLLAAGLLIMQIRQFKAH